MKRALTGRRQSSIEDRLQMLQNYRQSGLTQREFAKRHGISLSTLQLWRRKYPQSPAPGKAAFIEAPQLQGLKSGSSPYRLEFSGSLALEVRSGFQPEELKTILQLIHSL
jgi:transposase-like protein